MSQPVQYSGGYHAYGNSGTTSTENPELKNQVARVNYIANSIQITTPSLAPSSVPSFAPSYVAPTYHVPPFRSNSPGQALPEAWKSSNQVYPQRPMPRMSYETSSNLRVTIKVEGKIPGASGSVQVEIDTDKGKKK